MTAKQKRAAEIKLLERELEVLNEIADDAKFPVTVEQVRRISVKRVRDRQHRDVVRGRVQAGLEKLRAQDKAATAKQKPEKTAA
jgi:hypothetical protein